MKHRLLLLASLSLAAFAAEKMPLPTTHTIRNIEDWTVRVDDRLLFIRRRCAGRWLSHA